MQAAISRELADSVRELALVEAAAAQKAHAMWQQAAQALTGLAAQAAAVVAAGGSGGSGRAGAGRSGAGAGGARGPGFGGGGAAELPGGVGFVGSPGHAASNFFSATAGAGDAGGEQPFL